MWMVLIFYWISNTNNFCYGVRRWGNVGVSRSWTGTRSARFLYCTSWLLHNCWISPWFLLCPDRNRTVSSECLHFLSRHRSQKTLDFGVFQAPLAALVLQLLHTLPVSSSSSSPLCSVAAETSAPQRHLLFLQLLSTTLPIHPCVPTEAHQLIIWSSWRQGWSLASTQHDGILLCENSPEQNSSTNISAKVLEIEKGLCHKTIKSSFPLSVTVGKGVWSLPCTALTRCLLQNIQPVLLQTKAAASKSIPLFVCISNADTKVTPPLVLLKESCYCT